MIVILANYFFADYQQNFPTKIIEIFSEI